MKYLAALSLRDRVNKGSTEPVTAIKLEQHGRPLSLGELNEKVQAYTYVH